MEYTQVKSINIEGVAFLAQDMPTRARGMATHQDVHISGYSCEVIVAQEARWHEQTCRLSLGAHWD